MYPGHEATWRRRSCEARSPAHKEPEHTAAAVSAERLDKWPNEAFYTAEVGSEEPPPGFPSHRLQRGCSSARVEDAERRVKRKTAWGQTRKCAGPPGGTGLEAAWGARQPVCTYNPPSEINILGKEPTLPSTSIKKVCIENKEPLINLRHGTVIVYETEDNNRETREKEFSPPAGNKQSQVQQIDQLEQLEHQSGERATSILRPSTEGEILHKSSASPKRWGKITGKDPQCVDWGKDNSDKFYSLTEESNLSSGDHSFGGSDDSKTSEAENKSSSNEPTVRQLRRQRKSVKTRPCSQEGLENSTSTGGRTLKWDYSSIGLADSPSISNQGPVNGKKETDTGPPTYNLSTMGTEAGMLQSIYSSIKELQTETRIESRRVRIATKRLQGTVCKVAKSCTEIETKLCSMEERIVAVEEDVDTLKEQSATRDEQLTDVMWKLEDFENRQRRNNP
ncbi:hypothetical protein NDU88_005264 [Pleurodeles waltl]|uniref:Uncharacterized protein n=1 Tax=Pleurodeles waltl TaxID=8319 RepID=A0AAV7M9H8_PLEWA|nr:hypothetical protein NDU88_005264 [Pleurodeles waltl]